MYGCEAWTLTDDSLHKLNTAWNNCFWQIYHVAGEKLLDLCSSFVNLYQCNICLINAINLVVEDVPLNNIVLKKVSGVNYDELLATCSKYSTDVSDMSENINKQTIWNVFSHTADADL